MSIQHFAEWKDELSVGVEELDSQHKTLIESLNRLYDEVSYQASHAVLKERLNEFVERNIVHFVVEESLCRIFNYPATDEYGTPQNLDHRLR